jgi:hypothetical protein
MAISQILTKRFDSFKHPSALEDFLPSAATGIQRSPSDPTGVLVFRLLNHLQFSISMFAASLRG